MPIDKNGKRVKPNRPREVVREELLSNPDVARTAKALKQDLAQFVESILDFAYNPDKEPVLKVAPDEELRKAGYEPPTFEQVGSWLRGALKRLGQKLAINEVTGTTFARGKKPSVLDVPPPPTSADTAEEPVKTDPKLLKDIKRNLGPKG